MSFKLALLSIYGLLVGVVAKATIVESKIFIVSGVVTYLDSFEVNRLSYSTTSTPSRRDFILSLKTGDTLRFEVTNTTDQLLGFSIDGVSGTKLEVKAKNTSNAEIVFGIAGVFPLSDHLSPYGKYLGLQGFVLVEDIKSDIKTVVWNLSDFEMNKTHRLMNSETIGFSDYRPDFFTINGDVFPEGTDHPIGQITGNVGDTIRVYLANSGKSIHSIHFHGYHVTVKTAKIASLLIGASKDTVPIKPDELMELTLVPDKPGKYPVHNHSLSGVVTNGLYPSGQFSIMTIGL